MPESEKEISSLIKSIVDSCRTFYVGNASPVDDDGFVSLNGIRAAVVGAAEQADVIIKDAISGSWFAFVRGIDRTVVETKDIQLYLSLPTGDLDFSLLLFVSSEGLQSALSVRGLRQIVGVFGFNESKPYYTELAPWLSSIPAEFSFEANYFSEGTGKKRPKKAVEDATLAIAAEGEEGSAEVSIKSLPGAIKIDIGQIEKEKGEGGDPPSPAEQTFIQLYLSPAVAESGIREVTERWAIGFSRDPINTLGGLFGAEALKKSICFGFKNEVPRNYSRFYAWFRQRLSFDLKWKEDPFDLVPTEACENAGAIREVITEFPLLVTFSENEDAAIIPVIYRNFSSSTPAYLSPSPAVELPSLSIFADFHFGDGDFGDSSPGSSENLTTLEFPHSTGDLVGSRDILYQVEKGDVLAKKMKLFIVVEGVKRYAKHVKYEGSENYRVGFFEGAQNAADTELSYFGDTFPLLHDPGSTTAFLSSQTLTFSTPADEIFAGDTFLWSNVFREGSFPSTGFINPIFPEIGPSGSFTFIQAEEDSEKGYATSVPIQIEILPAEEWAYKESLGFFSGEAVLLEAVESPLPRMTIDTRIRVAFRESTGSLFGRVMAGYYGRTKESVVYYSLNQRFLYATLVFQRWLSTPDSTAGVLTEEGDPKWQRFYFPDQRVLSIQQEYPENVARKARLYIDRDSIRYYAYLESNVIRFADPIVQTPTTFHLEVSDEIPRRFNGGVSNTTETLVEAPFDGRCLRFQAGVSGRLEWQVGDVFEKTGWAGAIVSSRFDLYRSDTTPSSRTQFTIGVEYAPEPEWAKTERIIFSTLEHYIAVDSDLVVKGGEPQTNAYIRVLQAGATTQLVEEHEVYRDLEQYSTDEYGSLDGMRTSCSFTTLAINRRPDSDSEVFYGFLHLESGTSSVVDLSPTNLSFSDSSVTVYADGKLSFQGLELIPFVAPLDTKLFLPYDPFSSPYVSGYISYTEGFVDDLTKGINEVPCLRIDWRRAYPAVPGASDYYDDLIDEKHVDFEVLFIDLEDRIDVVYRYLYIGYESTEDIPLAGITEESCIFPGSGEANGLNDLADRKVSSNNAGEARFYIKEGKLYGYDEITLFEDGSAELPIRRTIPPIANLYREICGLIRIETSKEPGAPASKKVSLYLSDRLVDGEIDLTDPVPPTMVAETGGADAFGQPPLENKNKVI